MGFFATLRRLLGTEREEDRWGHADRDAQRARLLQVWGLDEPSETAVANAPPVATPPPTGASDYDRTHWRKKLAGILDRLPDSRDQWDDMMADAAALGLDPGLVEEIKRAEFLLLIRRAVADRRVTEDEHRKLDEARRLIGLSEAEAEAMLREVVSEAESFFGKAVQGAD